ncbi:hypothetical protein DYH09_25185 [bacterium CPR1]|nr:hypothetical protein [bacterium CPR1]
MELEDDFSVTNKYVQLGTFVGEIYKIECQKELCHPTYRIWVNLNFDGKWRRLYRTAGHLRWLMEELQKFGMTPDDIDVSEGLDCSSLIGRAIKAEVYMKIAADGSTSYWIGQIAPLA